MAALVTANVGNAIAGGIVMEEAPDLGYATWPEFAQKTTGQILDIFAQRVRERGADPNMMADNGVSAPDVPANGGTPALQLAGGGMIGLLILGAALYFLSR